jgi:hypothetical protein
LPDTAQSAGTYLLLCLVFLALQIWIAVKGNEMTAKNLLEKGWSFSSPNTQESRFAMMKWNLSFSSTPENSQNEVLRNEHSQSPPPRTKTYDPAPSALTIPVSTFAPAAPSGQTSQNGTGVVRNPGVGGEALAAFVKGVWTAFPDFTIELLNVGEIEAGVGALHWRASGTNSGPGGDDSEPTGLSVSFQGASIIRVEGDKIRSDYAYYDRKGLDEQLAPKSLAIVKL